MVFAAAGLAEAESLTDAERLAAAESAALAELTCFADDAAPCADTNDGANMDESRQTINNTRRFIINAHVP
jgi:hypothetical protein